MRECYFGDTNKLDWQFNWHHVWWITENCPLKDYWELLNKVILDHVIQQVTHDTHKKDIAIIHIL